MYPPTGAHDFLVGQSNNKIEQYDARTGTITQTYDYHLAAVNTVLFVDGGKRYVLLVLCALCVVYVYHVSLFSVDTNTHTIYNSL